MKKYNKPSELTKKLIALGLAGAISVMGLTACNTNDNTNTSTTSAYTETTTSKTENPIEQEQGLDKVAALVKKMINETYAQNFDYYVKSVTITGINIKKAEAPQVDYAPGVYADYQEPTDSIIDISYVAESVNKTTGEEKVVSNDISYIVSSEAASEVVQQGVDNVEINTLADAIVESTQEKIEAEEITGTNENDNIAGVQLSKKEELAHAILDRIVLANLNSDEYGEYLANGYSLSSVGVGSPEKVSIIIGKAGDVCSISYNFLSPVGELAVWTQNGEYLATLTVRIFTKASKEDEEVQLCKSTHTEFILNESEYNEFYNIMKTYTDGYLDQILANIPEVTDGYVDEYVLADSIKITDEVYSKLKVLVENKQIKRMVSSPIMVNSLPTGFSFIQKLAFNALNVPNNPLVVVTEPNSELDK